MRNFPQKSAEEEPQVGRKRINLDLPKPDQVHEAVRKIACEMNQDDISLVGRSERDSLSLRESMYNARKPHERRNDYIHQKMREMARLSITASAITPLKSTEDLSPCDTSSFAGYELESNSYKIPSLALGLGNWGTVWPKLQALCNAMPSLQIAMLLQSLSSNLLLYMRKGGWSPFHLRHWVHFNKPNGINHRFYPLHRICHCCKSFLLLIVLSA